MKIIDPSFEIQDDLDNSSIAVRLEACNRICYKSEEKITEDSAIPFVRRIAEHGQHGHNSVMEMAAVSFRVSCHPDHVLELLSCQPKYLVIDRTDDGMLVSGSIRTFRELYGAHPHNQLVNDLVTVLAEKEPHLFDELFDPANALEMDPQVRVTKLSLAEVDALPHDQRVRHRFVGVKFIVNRA
ncbi:MAG: FAD-dependent thymidylate synthase, partial [Desulforhopalus sp.]